MVIQLLNILGKIVREHFVDSVLVAVSNGSIVVPALKAEHIKRLLKTLNFLFYGFFLIFKKFSPLRIGRTALGAPLHKFSYFPDFKSRFFEAFNYAECFKLSVGKSADTRKPSPYAEKVLLYRSNAGLKQEYRTSEIPDRLCT